MADPAIYCIVYFIVISNYLKNLPSLGPSLIMDGPHPFFPAHGPVASAGVFTPDTVAGFGLAADTAFFRKHFGRGPLTV